MKQTLSAPWYEFRNKLAKLFEGDPQIEVGELVEKTGENDADFAVNISVKSHDKFIALERVMPQLVPFGTILVQVILYDEENADGNDLGKVYETIFAGNPLFKDVKTVTDPAGVQRHYVRFQPEVIQFPNDDISDYSGNWSGLAEDIASEVFGEEFRGVHFCTVDVRENLDAQGGA